MTTFGRSCPLCCWDLERNAGKVSSSCRFCDDPAGNPGADAARVGGGRSPVVEEVRAASLTADGEREREVVRRAQSFDEGALSELFEAYYPRMYTYGLSQLRNVQAAEDFASDVLLRVLDGIRRYRLRQQPFSAWVFRIARNRLIDIQRRQRKYRQVPWEEKFSSIGAGQAPITQVLDIDEIQLGLCELTEGQAQVIVLRFLHDLDVTTVAKVLGRSERAVKSLQFRALLALRETLADAARAPAAAPRSMRTTAA